MEEIQSVDSFKKVVDAMDSILEQVFEKIKRLSCYACNRIVVQLLVSSKRLEQMGKKWYFIVIRERRYDIINLVRSENNNIPLDGRTKDLY